MPPIVVCTVNGKCLPVLAASIKAYSPGHELLVSEGPLRTFGEAYNDAMDAAFKDHDEILIANDDIVGSAGYDPDVMDDLVSLLGDAGTTSVPACVTIHMPQNTTHSYFAFLKAWKFGGLRVAQFPTGNYGICVTNYDPVNKVEAGVYTVQAAGT